MNKMKPVLTSLLAVILLFIFARNMINTARADDMESIWKSDGSLVNIYGAEESGYVIKGDDSGTEIEYFVKPKDDGSPTFIYDDELIICTNTGCY